MRLLILFALSVFSVSCIAQTGNPEEDYETAATYYKQGDYKNAFRYFMSAAKVGYANAQTDVGNMYNNGEGVAKSYSNAYQWYLKAANQDHHYAQNHLGDLYYDGNGVKQDYMKAFEWYLKAAEQGYRVAQNNLGDLYYDGNGVKQDYMKAYEWYLKAAEQGFADAQNNLGFLYDNGYGVKQDYMKAFEWYSKAAEQGLAGAQNNLGDLYYDGNGVKQDYMKAFEWYLKAAEQGFADAQNNLGFLYDKGYGVKQDYMKAFEWYSKAAEQGLAGAQNNLGNLYYDGNGVKQDYMKAYEWYLKAAEKGLAEAQNNLGFLYDNGYGVKQDYMKAFEWYSKAANKGHADAQNRLGYLYYRGEGVKQDYIKAYELFSQSAENGEPAAMYHLGKMFLNGKGINKDYTKAEFWLKSTINSDSSIPFPYSTLALLYAQRDKDYTRALQYSDKAIALFDKTSDTYYLATFYGERGLIYYWQGDMINAEKMLAKCLEFDSDYLKNDDDFAKLMAKKTNGQKVNNQINNITEIQNNIDSIIFVNPNTNKNTFAVIIGNEKYKNEADVPFAENDAKIFKEYVQKTLGVPEKQIKFITNASLNEIRIAIRWLKQAMEICSGQGKSIFYYAGHGIPDEADKTALLLPTDGIGSDPESAYSLQRLYDEFNNMPAQRTTVFLDACFSGSKREGDMMASARGVAIDVNPMTPKGKTIVFTAAQGDQTAYPFNEQQHGMFTYFLLKKLQDTKGNVTLGELSDYLTTEVKRKSFVENNKVQTPTVKPSAALASSWRKMKLISE